MIPNREGRHYIAIKTLSALLIRLMSNDNDFYCLNYLHSLRTKNKLESPKQYMKKKLL